jgi:hypothetical protein
MSIFAFKDGKVAIEPLNLTIPEFKEIYDRDTSKDKIIAYIELCYVYHMSDFKSPYNNYDDKDKDHKIRYDYIKDPKWNPDNLILNAISKYKEINETPSLKLLKDCRKAIEKVRTYVSTVDMDEVDSKGNKANKITDLSKVISDVGKMVESLDKIEERVKKEELNNTKVRGNKRISDFER